MPVWVDVVLILRDLGINFKSLMLPKIKIPINDWN